MLKRVTFTFLGVLFLIGGVLIVSANDISIFSANIFPSDDGGETVSIEVPDRVYLGNVSIGDKSNELKIYINNTGTTNIQVTPKLVNGSEVIMSNLYLRKFQTSGGNPVNYTRIGDFSFNITKPAGGETYNDGYFYAILDLTNYNSNLSTPLLNYEAQVKFIAVAY